MTTTMDTHDPLQTNLTSPHNHHYHHLHQHPNNNNYYNSSSSSSSGVVNVTGWKDLYMVVMYHTPFAIAVDRYTTPVWCLIGLIGNILSVRIWLMRRMRKCNSSASYLATLAVSDLLFLGLVVPNELQYAWLVGSLEVQGWCQVWNVLYMATQYFSLLLVSAFTLERFLSVCRPFDCQRFSRTSRSAKVIAGILLASLLLSLPQAFFWTFSAQTSECQLKESNFRVYHVWNWASEITMFGLLPILGLCLNVCVLRQIRSVGKLYVTEASAAMMASRRQSQARCSATTMTLLWISFYLIFTKLPVTIAFSMQTIVGFGDAMTLEAMASDPTWRRYLTYFTVRKVIDEIGISHHACNFFIYCLTSRQFRQHVQGVCWKCCVSCADLDYPGSARLPPSNKTHKNVVRLPPTDTSGM